MSKLGPIRGKAPNDREVLPGLWQSDCGTLENPKTFSEPLPLAAYRLAPNWGENRYTLVVAMMISASGERRINASSKGLIEEAAKTIIRFSYRDIVGIYRERGVVLNVPFSSLDEIRCEYAKELAESIELKREVNETLDAYRQLIVGEWAFGEYDEMFSFYPEAQSPIQTMNIWREYADILLAKWPCKVAFDLRRLTDTCVIVHDAVFNP